jgi:arylsulfatase A-like enzyme
MPSKKPNVLVLFTDDQRFDTIAALGNEAIRTPNIDRLVARGTAFTQAHIPSGTVGAVCMPSRAMLHTGRSLYHLDGAGETIPERFTLLGQALGDAGYATFGTGKWHNGPEAFNRSFADGGEIMFGGMADHWNVPMCDYDRSGSYDNVHRSTPDAYGSNRTMRLHVDHITPGEHSTDLVAEAAVGFLENADPSRPFFTYVSFLAPHDPRTMPQRFLDMYDPATIDVPESFAAEHPFDYGVRSIRDEKLEAYPRTEEAIRTHIAEYYAMISHLDDAVGRIVGALERRGLLDDTIVVFAGDNGLALGRHGLLGKQSTYEHSVRVPLVFAGPGVPSGATSDAFVYLFDVFPTLCELAGVDAPDSIEGSSLVATMSDAGAGPRDDLYFGYGDLVRSVKSRSHKLICYAHESQNHVQLYDLGADPGETRNVAGLPEHAEAFRALLERVVELRDAWDDRESAWGSAFWDRWERNGGVAGAAIVR